jgi:hypothetical protein
MPVAKRRVGMRDDVVLKDTRALDAQMAAATAQ